MTKPGTTRRVRNKPGEGSRLRNQILDASFAILDEEGTIDAVTLRAVARRVGATAPAIYGHFEDLDRLRGELQSEAFDDMMTACDKAAAPLDDPVLALLARCEAMVTWGIERPGRYRLLFTRIDHMPNEAGEISFNRLVAAADACGRERRYTGTDSATDCAHLLVALNGLVLTRTVMTGFHWPGLRQAVHDITTRLLRIGPTPD
jgi:AcrR family transcriptional regulator